MPVVRINDATFLDLSILKTWHGVKTPSEIIDLLVKDAIEELGIERDNEAEGEIIKADDNIMLFENTPGLAFTKPLSASIDNKPIHKPNWSNILFAMIERLESTGLKGEKLVSALAVPAKNKQYEDDGFKYSPSLGISVQGRPAQDCWKEIDRIAKTWRIPVSVKFWWRENKKAQHPGKTGLLRSGMI